MSDDAAARAPTAPLSGIFARARGGDGAEPAEPALEATLLALHERGRAAWPGLSVHAEEFASYLATRAAAGSQPPELARLHAEDLYLACACSKRDQAALALADARFLSTLPQHLTRRGYAQHLAEEVVQALRERLFLGSPESPNAGAGVPQINDYAGRGSLASWLRVAAARAASNARRDEANRADLLANGDSDPALPALDPELSLIVARHGPEFRAALRDAFESLLAEERSVLRLHFEQGLSLEAAARALGISRATAGRRMLAGRLRIREIMLQLLGQRLSATPTELDSILGVVRSKLELSLSSLLRSRGN